MSLEFLCSKIPRDEKINRLSVSPLIKDKLGIEPFPDFSKYELNIQKQMYQQFRSVLMEHFSEVDKKINENYNLITEYGDYEINSGLKTYQNKLYMTHRILEVQLEKVNTLLLDILIKIEKVKSINTLDILD